MCKVCCVTGTFKECNQNEERNARAACEHNQISVNSVAQTAGGACSE